MKSNHFYPSKQPQKYTCIGACLHRGNKADFGHYVAVFKEEAQSEWILCNDSKVVVAEDAPVEECYLVFYKKNWIVCCILNLFIPR